jgi:hypothetical protein
MADRLHCSKRRVQSWGDLPLSAPAVSVARPARSLDAADMREPRPMRHKTSVSMTVFPISPVARAQFSSQTLEAGSVRGKIPERIVRPKEIRVGNCDAEIDGFDLMPPADRHENHFAGH